MKNLNKHLLTVGLVATGVVVAGLAMYQFRDNEFIKNARNGYQGL